MNLRILLLALLLSACNAGPEAILWGKDTCAQCGMILEDRRFGAELVARNVYKFDGIDELARYEVAHPSLKGSIYVTDDETGQLIPAAKAFFLLSPSLTAPMGGHVMSFAARTNGDRYAALHHLRAVHWISQQEAIATVGGTVNAKH